MIHIYNIEGMTCSGCQSSVEQALLKIPEIDEVAINLTSGTALVSMKSHLPIQTLQASLSSKYQISEANASVVASSVVSEDKNSESDFKKLRPLFLIFLYITVTAAFLNIKPWDFQGFMLDFMGVFYIVFSFFKILDLKGFNESFKMYDPLAKVVPIYAITYPFIELGLGLLFLFRFQIDIALLLTIVILGITTIGVIRSLIGKKTIKCACLGTVLNLPMTKATFIENILMIVMAVYMLINTVVL